jgi:hypothetical protein
LLEFSFLSTTKIYDIMMLREDLLQEPWRSPPNHLDPMSE